MAGCIAYSSVGGEVRFLFHSMTFVEGAKKQSKKLGYYMDCGGGGHIGESIAKTAVREFHEETQWVFADHIAAASGTKRDHVIEDQVRFVESQTPLWTDYACLFLPVPYISPEVLLEPWNNGKTEEKPRRFHWLSYDELAQCAALPQQPSNGPIKPFWDRLVGPDVCQRAAEIIKNNP